MGNFAPLYPQTAEDLTQNDPALPPEQKTDPTALRDTSLLQFDPSKVGSGTTPPTEPEPPEEESPAPEAPAPPPPQPPRDVSLLGELFGGAAQAAPLPAENIVAGEQAAPPPPRQGGVLPPGDQSNVLFGHGTADTVAGYFGAGINHGVRGFASSMVSVAGLGIGKIEDQLGVVNPKSRLSNAFFEWSKDIDEGGPQRQILNLSDLELSDPMGWLKYSAGAMGEGIPFLLSILAGGAGTQALSAMAARRGVAVGVRNKMLQYAPAFLQDARNVGALATGIGIETGITARQLYELTGQTSAIPSVVAGTTKGVIDVLLANYLSRALGMTSGMSYALARELGQSVLGGAGGMVGRELINKGVGAAYGAPMGSPMEFAGNLLDAATKGGIMAGPFTLGHHLITSPPGAGAEHHTAMDAAYQDLVAQVSAEMPTVLGSNPASPVTVPVHEVLASVADGTIGGHGVAAGHTMDEMLAASDARAGDFLYAPMAPETTHSIGFSGKPGQETLMHESRPLNDGPHVIVSPADAPTVRTFIDDNIRRGKDRVDVAGDSITLNHPDGTTQEFKPVPTLEQGGMILHLDSKGKISHVADAAAPIEIKGRDAAFGTPDFAVTEGKRRGAVSYVALDKTKVRRGDVTAGVEDLPSSVNDPRVTLEGTTDAKASAALLLSRAIRLREAARANSALPHGEIYFNLAEQMYRRAIQAGARVEPNPHGTIRLRDESKLPNLTIPADGLRSTVTSAKIAGSKIVDGKKVPYFDQEGIKPTAFQEIKDIDPKVQDKLRAEKVPQLEALRHKALDLANVNPGDVTGMPDTSVFLKLLRNNAIFRDYDVTLARRVGIDAPNVEVLKKFVQFMVTHEPGKPLSEARQARFFELVKDGLRLRVDPQTDAFVVLRDINRRELVDVGNREVLSTNPTLAKPREGRTKVLKTLDYEHPDLKQVYETSLHNSQIQNVISGYVRGKRDTGRVGTKTPDPADSLGGPLEQILRPFGIKDQIQIRIVSPKLQPGIGVIVDRPSVKGDRKTIININPWHYAQDTARGKEKRASKGMTLAPQFGVDTIAKHSTDGHIAKFWSDLGNSIGHITYLHEWERMPEERKDALREAYNREINEARMLDINARVARTMAHPLIKDTVDGLLASKGNYDVDFETWLAQGVGRWFTTDKKVMDATSSVFVRKTRTTLDRISDVIRRFMDEIVGSNPAIKKAIRDDLLKGGPDPQIASFIVSLEQRFKATGEPLLTDASKMSALQSKIAAQKDLAGLGLEHVLAEPASASGAQLRVLLKNFSKDLPPESVSRIEGLLAMNDKIGRVLQQVVGVHEIAKANPHVQEAQTYVGDLNGMHVTKSSWASLADERVRQVMSLGKAQAEKLHAFLYDYDRMSYLDQDLLKRGKITPRRPTQDELMDLIQEHELSRESFGVFREMNRDFLQFLGDLEQTTIAKIKRTVSDAAEQEAQIKDVNEQMQQLRYRPYFPHMRFGDHLLTIRELKNERVHHFEAFYSKADRDAMSLKLLGEYPTKEFRHDMDVLSDVSKSYLGLPPFALKAVLKELGLDQPNLTVPQRKEKRTLETLMVKSLPETSYRKQLLRRGYVPGYSMDGLRAYATYFTRASAFLARQKYSDTLQDSVNAIRNSAFLAERDNRTRMADYFQKHLDDTLKGGTEFATVRGLTYMWYLGFVPVSAFINMTQVPLTTFPHLSAKFGDFAAPREIAKGLVDGLKTRVEQIRKGTVRDEGILTEAIDQANRDRHLQDGFVSELAATAGGSTLQRLLPGNKAERKLRQVANAASWMFSSVEKFNRHSTFRAAFNLALKHNDVGYVNEVAQRDAAVIQDLVTDKGWTRQQARAYVTAVDAVKTTQFQYSQVYRPNMARGGVKSLLFLLKNYNINMANLAFRGDKGTVIRFWLTMAVAGGMMGLPGAEDATKLVKLVMDQMGYKFDVEREIRQHMHDFGVGKAADYILHGASRNSFGLHWALNSVGVPSPNVDLSRNLSLGRLVPGLAAGIDAKDSASVSEFLGKVVEDISGPAFSMPFNIYQAVHDQTLLADDPKRWERALPRSARQLVKGTRYLAEEMERDRKGNAIVPMDSTDPQGYMEGIATALGFAPTRVNQIYDLRQAQREEAAYWQTRRTALIGDFFRATKAQDKDAQADAIKAIVQFNSELPRPEMRISGKGLKEGFKQRTISGMMNEDLTLPQKMYRNLGRDVGKLYPEVKPQVVK